MFDGVADHGAGAGVTAGACWNEPIGGGAVKTGAGAAAGASMREPGSGGAVGEPP